MINRPVGQMLSGDLSVGARPAVSSGPPLREASVRIDRFVAVAAGDVTPAALAERIVTNCRRGGAGRSSSQITIRTGRRPRAWIAAPDVGRWELDFEPPRLSPSPGLLARLHVSFPAMSSSSALSAASADRLGEQLPGFGEVAAGYRARLV